MIRIAIVEAQTIVRWALREALARSADFEVVGEAGTVQETLAMLQRTKPDVLLLDAAVPDHSGFDLLGEIRELEDGPLVIVLAALVEPTYVARVLVAGAHGYVTKFAEPEVLLAAIHAVSRGEQVIPPGVEKLLAESDRHPASVLTRREQQVMEMLARGMINREIAEHFDISVKTVDTHRGHLLKKLGLRNNSDLTRFAVRHGYITL